jgi:hypothetical protein
MALAPDHPTLGKSQPPAPRSANGPTFARAAETFPLLETVARTRSPRASARSLCRLGVSNFRISAHRVEAPTARRPARPLRQFHDGTRAFVV